MGPERVQASILASGRGRNLRPRVLAQPILAVRSNRDVDHRFRPGKEGQSGRAQTRLYIRWQEEPRTRVRQPGMERRRSDVVCGLHG